MPYRRYNKKRYTRRTYRRYKKKSTWGSTAMKALKLATRVAGLVNTEYKYVERSVTALNVTQSGVMHRIIESDGAWAGITQGVSVNQRTGDSIKSKNLTVRFYLQNGDTDTTLFRVIVFWDKFNTILNPNNFLEASLVGTASGVIADRDEEKKFEAKTLYDKTFKMDSASQLITKSSFVIKLDKHSQFEIGTANVERGSLKMLFITNRATAVSNITYFAKLTYVDN